MVIIGKRSAFYVYTNPDMTLILSPSNSLFSYSARTTCLQYRDKKDTPPPPAPRRHQKGTLSSVTQEISGIELKTLRKKNGILCVWEGADVWSIHLLMDKFYTEIFCLWESNPAWEYITESTWSAGFIDIAWRSLCGAFCFFLTTP